MRSCAWNCERLRGVGGHLQQTPCIDRCWKYRSYLAVRPLGARPLERDPASVRRRCVLRGLAALTSAGILDKEASAGRRAPCKAYVNARAEPRRLSLRGAVDGSAESAHTVAKDTASHLAVSRPGAGLLGEIRGVRQRCVPRFCRLHTRCRGSLIKRRVLLAELLSERMRMRVPSRGGKLRAWPWAGAQR